MEIKIVEQHFIEWNNLWFNIAVWIDENVFALCICVRMYVRGMDGRNKKQGNKRYQKLVVCENSQDQSDES